jgi:hypothetical protein
MWGLSIPFWESVFRWATISAFVLGGFTATAAFISAWVGYELTDIVQKDADRRIAEAKADLGVAQADIEKSKVEIAHANERVALATQKANEAALALEKFKAPRAISPEQRNRIAEEMKKFAGQEYFGMVASGVPDAWDIWRELSLSLELAGWKRVSPPGPEARQYGPPAGIAAAPLSGVMVYSGAGNAPPPFVAAMHERAKALAAKLTDESITTGAGFTGDISNPAAIAIVIGPKP